MRIEDNYDLLQYEINRLEDEIDRYRKALESISKNMCCDRCREAALVAREALHSQEVQGE